jgi:cell division protein ZapA (FtsZ GTPase activity inhibitor)
VDNTISDIRRAARMMEPHKAAILAALSIVDQYFKASRELESIRSDSDSTAARLAGEIEQRLASFDLAANP